MQETDQKQKLRNKKRLITQNKKLNTQLRKLQTQMNDIIGDIHIKQQQSEQFSKSQSNQMGLTLKKLRNQLAMQDSYTRKLRDKVDFLKSSNVKGNAQYITKEQDDLKIVKKQYYLLIQQKQTVIKFKQDKLKQLQRNQPFQQHKKKVQHNLADIHNENRKMQSEITELQRQIRKYHNYIIMNKLVVRQKNGQKADTQYQLAKARHQSGQIKKKIKDIQDKWKPQFQNLDTIYFQLKNQFIKKTETLATVQKQHRMWETRKNGLRDEQQISQYRDRLSKVNTTEWKIPKSTTVIRKSRQNYSFLAKTNKKKQLQLNNKSEQNQNKAEVQEQEGTNKFSQANLPVGIPIDKKIKVKSVRISQSPSLNNNKKKETPPLKQIDKKKPNESITVANKNKIKVIPNESTQKQQKTLQKSKSSKKVASQAQIKDVNQPKKRKDSAMDNKNNNNRKQVKSEHGKNNIKNQQSTLKKQKSDKKIKEDKNISKDTEKNKKIKNQQKQKSPQKNSSNKKQTKQTKQTVKTPNNNKKSEQDTKDPKSNNKKPIKMILKSVGVGP